MISTLDRRTWLLATLATGASGSLARSEAITTDRKPLPFGLCLNTSTIHGEVVPIEEQVAIAREAGYDAIEPWLRDLNAYLDRGGSLATLGRQISDAGLKVPSAIGFAEWIVDDPDRRKKGLEVARRDMERLRAIGGTHIAAPPAGATDQANLSLSAAADRYHALLELGEQFGIVPQVEVWGFSKCLSTLAEASHVALATAHPRACVLADAYHLYKGGSPFEGLSLLNGAKMNAFHINDYPDIPRDRIVDADRVYPGVGVCPLGSILTTLYDTGFRGYLSLELFNREYWKQDPRLVARTGVQKIRDVVLAALGDRIGASK